MNSRKQSADGESHGTVVPRGAAEAGRRSQRAWKDEEAEVLTDV